MAVDILREHITGVKENGIVRKVILNTSATKTLAMGDSGAVIIDNLGSGTSTFTLPLAETSKGAEFTFVCGDIGGEILINPNALDQVSVKAAADGANVLPAAGTGVKNTAASNVLNDFVTLVSDGANTWHSVALSGIFASQ